MATIVVEQHAELELMPEAIVLHRGRLLWQGANTVLTSDHGQLAGLIGLKRKPRKEWVSGI